MSGSQKIKSLVFGVRRRMDTHIKVTKTPWTGGELAYKSSTAMHRTEPDGTT